MSEKHPDKGGDLGFSVSVAPAASEVGAAHVVRLLGELDMSSAPELRAAIDEAVRAAPDADLELDMRACSFVDSSGIAAIVAAARALHETGHKLRIRGARDRVLRILTLAGLEQNEWIAFTD